MIIKNGYQHIMFSGTLELQKSFDCQEHDRNSITVFCKTAAHSSATNLRVEQILLKDAQARIDKNFNDTCMGKGIKLNNGLVRFIERRRIIPEESFNLLPC